jgi:hypothetical protein
MDASGTQKSPKRRARAAAGVLCAAIIVCALMAAPRSCDGGLEVYLLAGLVGVLAMLGVPIVFRTDRSALHRLGLGLLFAAFGAAVWIAGLFGANVRIVCRLF